MGNSDLQAYLASKYMSGAKADAILERSSSDPNSKRRKKRKLAPEPTSTSAVASSGFKVADEDDSAWTRVGQGDEDDDEFKPVVQEKRGQFKSKSTGTASWSTIREADPGLDPRATAADDDDGAAEPEREDEKPVVVATTSRGGLQSAADLKAEQIRLEQEREQKRLLAAQRERERKRRDGGDHDDDEPGEGHGVTVYRDSSGRKIDLKLQKAEEAKRKRQELEREMAKMEWGKGLVQREDRERQKLEAEKLKRKGVARYADDAEMNDELKEVERWNDPAANFLTKSKGEKKKEKESRFPQYQGPPPPPNRFNIRPGYRWDGVDRGTGFEAKLMQKRNSQSMYKAAAHAFSTEDM